MEEVETAPADTTSDSSPSTYHQSHHVVTGATESGSTTLPSAKRHKTDVFPSLHEGKQLSLEGMKRGEGISRSSYRHPSGRVLPMAIASPFRLQENLGSQDPKTESLKEESSPMFHTVKSESVRGTDNAERAPEQQVKRSLKKKHLQNIRQRQTGGLGEEDMGVDSCDSDQSSSNVPRFNCFANENTKVDVGDSSSPVAADSDTNDESMDFSSSDRLQFAPPSTSTEDRANGRLHRQGMVQGTGRESEEVTKRPSLSSTEFPPRPPSGKKYHLFVSHSTTDKEWIREKVVLPLRNRPYYLQVAASYNFMPDSSRYDDKAIHSNMAESCVVLVWLSTPYVNSDRCRREWEYAVRQEEERASQVVVAAAAPCSCPKPLRRFLYLDFTDHSKHGTVLNKLLESISSSGRLKEEGTYLRHGSSSPGSEDNDLAGEMDIGHQQRMAAEFEADLQQFEMEEESVADPRLRAEVSVDQPTCEEEVEGYGGSVESQEGGREEDEEGERKSEEGDGGGRGRREERGKDVEEGEVSDSSGEPVEGCSQSTMVASWYNRLAKPHADNRQESPIFHMRNFNNWVKSVLIRSYLAPSATVLDLCCGKGGDLLKWKEGHIEYLVAADISGESVEHCRGRHQSTKMLDRATRKPVYQAEFIVADCCEVRLRDQYKNSGCRFHVASCQFSVHYAFESYDRAHMMLRNACENLRRGGFFIGTTVDSNELIRRLRCSDPGEDGTWSIGNSLFTVQLDSGLSPWDKLPLFETKYYFRLHGVVDLPEFLIHFPLMVTMLQDFDMELVLHQNFYDFFAERRHSPEDAHLLYRMQAFDKTTGTMSSEQWDIIGLYMVFVFQKRPG